MSEFEKESLIDFPCDFPIKVIANNTDTILAEIMTITRVHYPSTRDDAFRTNNSQGNRYISVTVTVYTKDKATLDALYLDFTSHIDIKMVL